MSAIKRVEKTRVRALLKQGNSPPRIRKRKRTSPVLRIVHAPAQKTRLVPGRWFTDVGGQQIHLHPDHLDGSVEECQERIYMHRLKDLFLKPDQVWQDHDPMHGNYRRYLKFHFDYMLVASVDIRDPQHPYIFNWFALEYDIPAHARPLGRKVDQQQKGILIHSNERR